MEQKFTSASGDEIERLASKLDRTLNLLSSTEARLAGPLITPGETSFRDPRDVHHQITLGAVLCAYGLSAHHARALDGLLSMSFDQIRAVMAEAIQIKGESSDDEDENAGAGLLEFLELIPSRLEEFGRYAEWRRGFDRYMEATKPYLDGLTEDDHQRIAARPPSKKQMHLIRMTCAYHRIAFPAVPNRLAAFEWLRDFGANGKYRRCNHEI